MTEGSSRPIAAFLLGAFLALGLAGGAWFIARAIESPRRAERFVTVKGLSERDVPADLGIWPIRFSVAAENLQLVQEQIESSRAVVRQFLLGAGFNEEEISTSPPQITDADAIRSDSEERKSATLRYSATLITLLRSSRADDIRKAMETSDTLVQKGVALVGGNTPRGPNLYLQASTASSQP